MNGNFLTSCHLVPDLACQRSPEPAIKRRFIEQREKKIVRGALGSSFLYFYLQPDWLVTKSATDVLSTSPLNSYFLIAFLIAQLPVMPSFCGSKPNERRAAKFRVTITRLDVTQAIATSRRNTCAENDAFRCAFSLSGNRSGSGEEQA